MAADLGNLEADLRKARREIGRLKSELGKKARRTRDMKIIEEIADYWREAMGSRGKVVAGDTRSECVWWYLEAGYKPEEVKRAILGCARFPYQHYDRQLSSPVAGESKKRTDLTYICAKGRVDRFERLRDLGVDETQTLG